MNVFDSEQVGDFFFSFSINNSFGKHGHVCGLPHGVFFSQFNQWEFSCSTQTQSSVHINMWTLDTSCRIDSKHTATTVRPVIIASVDFSSVSSISIMLRWSENETWIVCLLAEYKKTNDGIKHETVDECDRNHLYPQLLHSWPAKSRCMYKLLYCMNQIYCLQSTLALRLSIFTAALFYCEDLCLYSIVVYCSL